MTRTELKEKLTQPTAESRRLYRLYPTLYRDLILWDDYLRLIAINRQKKYRAAKNYARYEITEEYAISEKTFYAICRTLRELCSDVDEAASARIRAKSTPYVDYCILQSCSASALRARKR